MNIKFSTRDVLVVEGVNDTKALTRALSCSTIETNGYNEACLPDIREARDEGFRVFVFPDTDPTGERIRTMIHRRVKGLLDVHLPPLPGKTRAPVEKADPERLLKALREAKVNLVVHLPVLVE